MSFSVHALHEGIFSVGQDKRMIPISKNDPPGNGRMKVAVNPFLVKTGDHNILIDAGLGPFGKENHYPLMLDNLAEHGLSEYDITDIYCSHLHFDHIGGLAHNSNGYWELSFPDAEIHLSGKEFKGLRDDDLEDIQLDFIDFIEARAKLNFLDEVDSGNSYISSSTIGGHTEFSQLIEGTFGEKKFLMAGDVLGSRGAVNRKYSAKYDFDGKKSMKLREHIAKRAYNEGAIILAYHDTESPMFKLSGYNREKGYIIKKAEEFNG